MGRFGRSTLAALCAALTLTPAVSAGERWGPEETIFGPQGLNLYDIDLAIAPTGDSLAVLPRANTRFQVASSEHRGPFGRRRLFVGDVPVVGLVSDASGRFVVLFYDESGLSVRTRTAGGAFGPRQPLDPRRHQLLDSLLIVTSPTGDVFVVWGTSSDTCACLDRLRVSVRPAREDRFGPVQLLSPPHRAAYDPHIAFDQFGDAVLAWPQFHDVNRGRVAYALRPAGSSAFGKTRKLSGGGVHGSVGGLDLASDTAGRVVAVWTARTEPSRDLRAAFGSLPGGFVGEQRYARGRVRDPHVAVDAGGEAVLTWHDPRPMLGVAGRRGQFREPRVLGPGRSTAPAVVNDGAGTFTVAWRSLPDRGVYAVRREAGAATGSPVKVGAGRAWRFSLAASAAHETLLGWSLHARGERDLLRGARVALARPQSGFGHPFDLRTGSWGPAFPQDAPHIETDAEGGAFVWWRRDVDGNAGYFGRFLFPP
jgi:hypothetical protein